MALTTPVRGMVWMAVASVFFAVTIGITRYLTIEYSVFQIVLVRQGIGLVLIALWSGRRGFVGLRSRQVHLHALRGLAAYSGVSLSVLSITMIAIADSQALQFTLPLLTAVVAAIFLGERIGGHRLVCIFIGFAGALVIIRPGITAFNIGMGVALASSCVFAFGDVLTRYVQRTDRTNVAVFYGLTFQVLFALLPGLTFWKAPGAADILPFVAMGVLSFGSQYCLTRAFAVAEASVVSPVLFTRLPLVAIVGFVFFGEVTDIWTWAGAGIIVASTWYMGRAEARVAAADARGQTG